MLDYSFMKYVTLGKHLEMEKMVNISSPTYVIL